MAKNMGMLLVMGILFFCLYYFSFSFCIIRFNLMTPGREVKKVQKEEESSLYTANYRKLAKSLLKACGGKGNVLTADACITRLRLEVKDPEQVDKERLREMGVMGIVQQEEDYQIIIGPQVHFLLEEIRKLL